MPPPRVGDPRAKPKITTFSEMIYQTTKADPTYAPNLLALKGMRVCLTGTMSAARSDVQQILEQHGAVVAGTISERLAATTILGVSNVDLDSFRAGYGGSTKLSNAKKLGVTMLSETELVQRCIDGPWITVGTASEPVPKVVAPPPDHYGDF